MYLAWRSLASTRQGDALQRHGAIRSECLPSIQFPARTLWRRFCRLQDASLVGDVAHLTLVGGSKRYSAEDPRGKTSPSWDQEGHSPYIYPFSFLCIRRAHRIKTYQNNISIPNITSRTRSFQPRHTAAPTRLEVSEEGITTSNFRLRRRTDSWTVAALAIDFMGAGDSTYPRPALGSGRRAALAQRRCSRS